TSKAPPVVSAGADKTITLPTNSTSFTGSASVSGGTISKYAWTKVSGGAATLTNANAATLNVSGVVAGTYTFRLTATDNSGAVASDDVKLTVNTSVKPVVNAGADKTITLPTNSTSFTGSASVSGGTISKYAWTKVRSEERRVGKDYRPRCNPASQEKLNIKSQHGRCVV